MQLGKRERKKEWYALCKQERKKIKLISVPKGRKKEKRKNEKERTQVRKTKRRKRKETKFVWDWTMTLKWLEIKIVLRCTVTIAALSLLSFSLPDPFDEFVYFCRDLLIIDFRTKLIDFLFFLSLRCIIPRRSSIDYFSHLMASQVMFGDSKLLRIRLQ